MSQVSFEIRCYLERNTVILMRHIPSPLDLDTTYQAPRRRAWARAVWSKLAPNEVVSTGMKYILTNNHLGGRSLPWRCSRHHSCCPFADGPRVECYHIHIRNSTSWKRGVCKICVRTRRQKLPNHTLQRHCPPCASFSVVVSAY